MQQQKHPTPTSTSIEINPNGVEIQTTASDNDILFIGLVGLLILTGFAMWIKYRLKVRKDA